MPGTIDLIPLELTIETLFIKHLKCNDKNVTIKIKGVEHYGKIKDIKSKG